MVDGLLRYRDAVLGSVQLNLPYPPTINHYYRHVGGSISGRKALTDKAKRFRHDVGQVKLINYKLIRESGVILPFCGPVAVAVELHPPDKKTRDVDNVLKPILDALQHAGILDNDEQVEALSIRRIAAGAQLGFCSVTVFDARDAHGLWAL